MFRCTYLIIGILFLNILAPVSQRTSRCINTSLVLQIQNNALQHCLSTRAGHATVVDDFVFWTDGQDGTFAIYGYHISQDEVWRIKTLVNTTDAYGYTSDGHILVWNERPLLRDGILVHADRFQAYDLVTHQEWTLLEAANLNDFNGSLPSLSEGVLYFDSGQMNGLFAYTLSMHILQKINDGSRPIAFNTALVWSEYKVSFQLQPPQVALVLRDSKPFTQTYTLLNDQGTSLRYALSDHSVLWSFSSTIKGEGLYEYERMTQTTERIDSRTIASLSANGNYAAWVSLIREPRGNLHWSLQTVDLVTHHIVGILPISSQLIEAEGITSQGSIVYSVVDVPRPDTFRTLYLANGTHPPPIYIPYVAT